MLESGTLKMMIDLRKWLFCLSVLIIAGGTPAGANKVPKVETKPEPAAPAPKPKPTGPVVINSALSAGGVEFLLPFQGPLLPGATPVAPAAKQVAATKQVSVQ